MLQFVLEKLISEPRNNLDAMGVRAPELELSVCGFYHELKGADGVVIGANFDIYYLSSAIIKRYGLTVGDFCEFLADNRKHICDVVRVVKKCTQNFDEVSGVAPFKNVLSGDLKFMLGEKNIIKTSNRDLADFEFDCAEAVVIDADKFVSASFRGKVAELLFNVFEVKREALLGSNEIIILPDIFKLFDLYIESLRELTVIIDDEIKKEIMSDITTLFCSAKAISSGGSLTILAGLGAQTTIDHKILTNNLLMYADRVLV
ncbi:MAG: hypothetical protein LBM01_03000 [Christensenellaceae bacterium]|jgi:transcription termination factor Rho|nr:hypothetical protein [Christensenellaceae bacterium]